MALIKCTECGQTISEQASVCPNCGCPIANAATPSSTTNVYNSEQSKKRVQNFLYINKDKLPLQYDEGLYNDLLSLNDNQWIYLNYLELKKPNLLLVISLLVGNLGIDRFMIGDTAIGVFKLILTLGYVILSEVFYFPSYPVLIAVCIWWINDVICIKKLTRKYNLEMIKTRIRHL